MLSPKNQVLKNKQNFEKAKAAKEAEKPQNPKGMLERLYHFCDYLDFDAALVPVSEENPVENLIVSVGEKSPDDGETELSKDYLDDHTMIQIMYINDHVDLMDKNEYPKKEKKIFHFTVLFRIANQFQI